MGTNRNHVSGDAHWQLLASDIAASGYSPGFTILDEPEIALDQAWQEVLNSYEEDGQMDPVRRALLEQEVVDFYLRHGLLDRLAHDEFEQAALPTVY